MAQARMARSGRRGRRRIQARRMIQERASFGMRPRGVGNPDPGQIRAQLLTGHGAFAGKLDLRAAILGDAPRSVDPLVHGGCRDAQRQGERTLATNGSAGFGDRVHGRKYEALPSGRQMALPHSGFCRWN